MWYGDEEEAVEVTNDVRGKKMKVEESDDRALCSLILDIKIIRHGKRTFTFVYLTRKTAYNKPSVT
jgi:hypothetical protein